ncbi:hypothetical protein MMC25_002480 [Agyrium rufum]|nr:hypothetical protein [Agyrium rufum]
MGDISTAQTESLPAVDRTIMTGPSDVLEGVSQDQIIAILPSSQAQNDGSYRLLYTTRTGTGPEARFETHSMEIHDPPPSLLWKHLLAQTPTHFSIPKAKNGKANVHVVVSVKSGTWEAERFFADVVQPILEAVGLAKSDYEVLHTSSEHSVVDFATNTLLPVANEGILQTVILLSGDGGMIDIVNVLLESTQSSQFRKPTIGLLSLGSGNALANSSRLNDDKTRGISSLLKGEPQSLPTFVTKFSPGSLLLVDEARSTEPLRTDENGVGIIYGTVVCSWALHAALVGDSDTTEYRKHGSERFSMAARELLYPSDGSEPHQWRGRVAVTRMDESGSQTTHYLDPQQHSYIIATMVSNLQQTLTISPHSRPLDGQLRLLHLGPTASDEMMRILGLAFTGGGHVNERGVLYEPVEVLRIEFAEDDEHWRRVCVDGKIVRVGKDGWVEVRRESRDVLDLIALKRP